MIAQIEDLVVQAVSRAFEVMVDLKVTVETAPAEIWNGEPHVAGAVGFMGDISGVVYLYSGANFARHLTARLIGIEDGDTLGDELVNDAIGELTNMVVGQIRSQLADRGMPCVLTVPSIVRGSHFVVDANGSTTRRVTIFRCGHERLVVETLIKAS